MRAQTIVRSLFGVILGVTLTSGPSSAAPVDCLATGCTVSDNSAVLITDDSQHVIDLIIQGVDEVFRQNFFATLGVNSAGNPVTETEIEDVLTLVSATQDEVTNQIVIVFSNGTVRVTATYTLVGAGPSATVSYTALVENLSDGAADLALVDYIDFDLSQSSGGDTVSFVGPDTIRQTDPFATGSLRSISSFDYFDVGMCCTSELFNRLVDGHLGGNSGPVGPFDVSGGFQNNIALGPFGSQTISRELSVLRQFEPTGVPSLSVSGLCVAVLALIGFGLFALRRQRAH